MRFKIPIVAYILFFGCSNPETRVQQLKNLTAHQLDSIKNRILKGYKDTTKFDTSFVSEKGDSIVVKLRNFCTYDAKINTPREYLDVYNIDNFQTHNFVTNLEFKINNKTVFKGFITKDDFNNQLDNELKKFGVLTIDPTSIDLNGKKLSIEYGIGVPLAAIESGYIMEIDSTGKKWVGSID